MVHTLLSTRNVSNRAISFFVSVKSFPDAAADDDEDEDVVVVCSCVNSSACFGLCRCAATREIFPEAASALHRVHVEQRSRLVVKVVDKDDDDEEEDEDDIFSFFCLS